MRGIEIVDAPAPLVVVWTSASAYVYDGASKALLRSIPLPADEIDALRVADLDDVPGLEMIAVDRFDLYEFDFETGVLREAHFGFGGSALAVGQTDADAALEVALAGNSLGGYLLDGATFEVDWGLLSGFGPRVWLADSRRRRTRRAVLRRGCPPTLQAIDPRTEETLWAIDASDLGRVEMGELGALGTVLIGVNQHGETLTVVSAAAGTALWSMPYAGEPAEQIALGDVDGDAAVEILVSTREEKALVAIDADERALEAEQVLVWGPFPGLALGDLDADGARELATASTRRILGIPHWDPLIFDVGSRAVEASAVPEGDTDGEVVAAAALAIDGDAPLEVCYAVVWSFGGRLFCLDGADRSEQFAWYGEAPSAIAVADLAGDGRPELFLAASDVVHAFGGEPFDLLWTSASYGFSNRSTSLRVGQVDDDPELELVWAGIPSDEPAVIVLDPASGALAAGPFEVGASALELAALDGGSVETVIVGTRSGAVATLDLETGVLAPPLATHSDEIRSLRAADLDRDGDVEIAVGVDGRVHVHDGSGGDAIWTSPFLHYSAAERDALYVDDLEGNSVPDLLVDFGIGFAVFEGPLMSLFADGFETGDASRWDLAQP